MTEVEVRNAGQEHRAPDLLQTTPDIYEPARYPFYYPNFPIGLVFEKG